MKLQGVRKSMSICWAMSLLVVRAANTLRTGTQIGKCYVDYTSQGEECRTL